MLGFDWSNTDTFKLGMMLDSWLYRNKHFESAYYYCEGDLPSLGKLGGAALLCCTAQIALWLVMVIYIE